MTELAPPWPASAQRLRLGDIEIDLRYRRVQRTGATQELNPRSFELLLLFLREPRVLHTRDEIFRSVWPGVIVEDASLTSSIWQLRRALGSEAKQWIRTVSKQGYVFDPPATMRIEILPAESRGSDAPADAANQPLESSDAPHVETPTALVAPSLRRGAARRPWLAWSTAVLAIVIALAAAALYRQRSTPLRLELVVQGDRAVATDSRWYAELLRDWLDWQLRAQPGVVMVSGNEVGSQSSNMAILLAVDMPAPGNAQWRVAARFRGAQAPPDIVLAAPADKLVAGIDAVARDTIAALTHASATAAPLTLDAAAAKGLAAGLAAEHAHNWNAAIKSYQAVLEQAPGFGFARLRLARCQYEFGQLAAAQAELARAQSWLEGLPPTLRRPFAAQEKLIRQDYDGAASAYADLQKNGGDTAPYRVAEAGALRRSGHTNEAAERLRGDVPTEPGQALDWLLERVVVESANRDLAHADADAASARELARTLGYDHDYAWATLAVAELQVIGDKPADAALFAEAVRAFEAAGDRLGALRARVTAELERTGVSDDPPHLDELLAEARLAGNSGVEIDVLRNVADFQSSRGDLQRAHERYAQAAAVAQAAGNLREQRELDLHLLDEDFERLDFDSLKQRIARLRGAPMQGRIAFAVGFTMVQLQQLRGDYDAALAEQRQAEKALLATAEDTPFAAVLVCQRASLALQQGRIAAARNDFRECRNSGIASVAQYADLGEAELATNTGDAATARSLLAPQPDLIAKTDDLQQRWALSGQVAALLLPLGQSATARRLAEDAMPGVTRAGYKLSEANLRNTLAQIALTEDRLELAAHEADLAAALLPPEAWQEQRRLSSVRVALAARQGNRALAAQRLSALHEEARSHGDVLAELQAHGLADAAGLTIAGCSAERRDELLAQSGMRGASDAWLLGSTAKVGGKAP